MLQVLNTIMILDILLDVTRILLVDDDEDNLKIFTIILENEGYSIDAYGDPSVALSEYKPGRYDLIILDYRMPEMNGMELYDKIREKDASLKIIRKPVSVGKLLEEVNDLLGEPSRRPANIVN